MYKKFFKNLGIGQKILIVVLFLAFITQISSLILTGISIINLSNHSQEKANLLGQNTAKYSEKGLKNQAESYLKEISFSMANSSNNALKEISNNVSDLQSSIEDIYRNKYNFGGHEIAVPEISNTPDSKEKTEKFYAVDNLNVSENKELVLAYDFLSSDSRYTENKYQTNINSWQNLSQEQRADIQKSKIVVSENVLPESIKNEAYVISNILHDAIGMCKGNDAISSIYIGTESGICYHYSPGNSSERYDPRLRKWYIDAVNASASGNQLPVWQSIYIGKSDKIPCITCSKAFTNSEGKVLGVIAVDMYIDNINKYVLGTNVGNTGYAFIVDKDGKIVIHPDYKPDESGNYPKNFESEPLKSESTSETYKNLINNMRSGNSGVETVEINDESFYISYSPLETTKWSLGAASKASEVLAPVQDSLNFIEETTKETNQSIKYELIKTFLAFFVIFIICSIITYILGIRFSKDILKPIKKLRNQAHIIGDGDFSHFVDVDSHDELGDLSESFNKMVKNLKIYMENLEKTTKEKEKIHSELMVAKKIQHSMLPSIFPAFPSRKDFDIYATMDPAKEVGGDFYDFFFTDKNHLALVISDVSGKGVSAALFMVIAKILLKNALQSGLSPEKAFEIVNNQLCENNEAGMFVTSFAGIVNIKTGKFTYTNAGHNPPLIYRKSENEYSFIDQPKGFVLGGMPNQKYIKKETTVSPEDTIFLYTDGVTESMNTDGKLFGEKQLEQVLNNDDIKELSIKSLISALKGELAKFSKGTEQADDITMLAFKDFKIPDKNPEQQ